MTALFDGITVKIPRGYHLTESGTYINGHGVEYSLVSYGWKEEQVVCLETVNGYRHTRTIELERVEKEQPMKLVKASVFVQRMKRKHGANPVWVWGMIEDNYNCIKGDGHYLNEDEMEELEAEIMEGLA